MMNSSSLLGRMLRMGTLAATGAVFTGCILENPGPDPDLYRRFNVYEFQLYGRQGPLMWLDLERRDGVIDVYARAAEGAQGDSAEVYLFGDNSIDPYPLPVYFSPSFEVYARVKTPIGNDSSLIGRSDNHLASDIRRVDFRINILREWKGDSLEGNRLGGLYAGEWSRRDRQHKSRSGKMRGLIDESGSFRFTFADEASERETFPLESLEGIAVGDSLLRPERVDERPIDPPHFGFNPFPDAEVVANGDSLRALIPVDSLYGDSLSIRCARVKAP